MNNDNLKCPYCGFEDDICSFPDLFYEYSDCPTEQVKLIQELQSIGYNVVTCGMCGEVFIQKLEVTNG